ncbi:MAG: hypothetical protein WCI51_01200 [Lentisphaerota bacterium]
MSSLFLCGSLMPNRIKIADSVFAGMGWVRLALPWSGMAETQPRCGNALLRLFESGYVPRHIGLPWQLPL